ncbi:Mitochondrial substrate carrier family protein S [Diplonema papillatum]|nr:Mitochondrial substrate carrier family protein S [Diplonema papillatum]
MDAAIKDVAAGTISGMCSKLIEYPFDTVKVRLHTDVTGKYTGALHCLKSTFAEGGVRGIYRGVGSPIAGAMAENATLFWAYGLAQRTMRNYCGVKEGEQLSLLQLSLCGSCSGVAVAHVLSPVERVKCLMQLQGAKYRNFVHCAVDTVRTGGVASLFKGHSSMLLREIPGNAAWYGGYEMFCKIFCSMKGVKKEELHPAYIALSGAFGGCAYWSAFFPADVVGSRMRGSDAQSFSATFKQIYREQGWSGLYRGWGVTMLRAFPANATIFLVYEKARAELDKVV